jgi:hypothetical protein
MRECGNAGMRECGNARMRGVEMAIVEFKKELEERTLSFSVDLLNYLFKLPSHPVFKVKAITAGASAASHRSRRTIEIVHNDQ